MTEAPKEGKHWPPGPSWLCLGHQQWNVNMGQLSYFTWATLYIQCLFILSAHGACWSIFKAMGLVINPPQRDQQGQQEPCLFTTTTDSSICSKLSTLNYTSIPELQPPTEYNCSISPTWRTGRLKWVTLSKGPSVDQLFCLTHWRKNLDLIAGVYF